MKYLIAPKLLRGTGRAIWLHPKSSLHPVRIREGTSDIYVFHQVFVEREYDCFDSAADVTLVIDCGANVGYTSAFLLSQFPKAVLIAVEPDPGNYAALVENVKPFGARARPLLAGVWSHRADLAVSSVPYRDGGAWARQVREVGSEGHANATAEGQPPAVLRGMDIGTLLGESGFDRISILKMDVEGAEAVVFSPSCQAWLPAVDAIAIELHDDAGFGSGTKVFFEAIAGHDFKVTSRGELTVCHRRA